MYAPTGTKSAVDSAEQGKVESPKFDEISRDVAPDSTPTTKSSGFVADCCPNDQMSFKPGGFGTYSSYFLIIAGMTASIIAMKYAPEKILSHKWTEGCEVEYEEACRAMGAVMRFSMALVIVFSMQLLGTALFTKFYDVRETLLLFGFVEAVTSYLICS
jgi:hypothetical protein